MERIPKPFYTTEFKEEAVKLVTDSGLKVAEVSRRLSLSPQTIRNWIHLLQTALKVPAPKSADSLPCPSLPVRRNITGLHEGLKYDQFVKLHGPLHERQTNGPGLR